MLKEQLAEHEKGFGMFESTRCLDAKRCVLDRPDAADWRGAAGFSARQKSTVDSGTRKSQGRASNVTQRRVTWQVFYR